MEFKMARNEITGDEIKSKTNTKEFEEGYDRIFKKDKEPTQLRGCGNAQCYCTGACMEPWDETRIDVVGQNGPTGIHYEENENKDSTT